MGREHAVVALNRAIAVAEVDGPGAALAITDDPDLGGYHLLHATRADFLTRPNDVHPEEAHPRGPTRLARVDAGWPADRPMSVHTGERVGAVSRGDGRFEG